MNPTNIEYLTHTWNPIAMRCTPVSEGCEHCWHLAMCDRLLANPKISLEQGNAYAGGAPMLLPERLADPLKRKKPARIGVQLMGDLFYEDVSLRTFDRIYTIIMEAERLKLGHTFIMLTKRPHRMQRLINPREPLENLWLGITAENQQRLEERFDYLLEIPAAVRFVSLEPLFGDIDLHMRDIQADVIWRRTHRVSYYGHRGQIDWVIIGGLSLPGGKIVPPKREWVDSIVEQCSDTGTPVFLKDNAQYPIERREFPKWTP